MLFEIQVQNFFKKFLNKIKIPLVNTFDNVSKRTI